MYTSFVISNGEEIKHITDGKNKIFFENRFSIECALALCLEQYAHIKINKIVHYENEECQQIIQSLDLHKKEEDDTLVDY